MTALIASPILPTAFIRGAIVKTIWPAVRVPGSFFALLIRAKTPGRGSVLINSIPFLTRILFSSVSDTISAAAANATRSRYCRTISFRPTLSATALANLNATPAPDKYLNGYSQPGLIGSSTATALGIISLGLW